MTAHELAHLLLAGPDVPVYVQACETGLKDATKPVRVRVQRDVRTRPPWYDGRHEEMSRGEWGLLLTR